MSGAAAGAISSRGSLSAHITERCSLSWSERRVSTKHFNQVVAPLLMLINGASLSLSQPEEGAWRPSSC
jgi:hypothetical protein